MRWSLLVCIALALAGAANPTEEPRSPEAQAKLDKWLDGRVAGEPRKCLQVRHITHPVSIDEYTLVFRDGPHVWLNQVRASFECGALGRQSAVSFEGRLGLVCSGDTMLFSNNGATGTCALGEFVPYDKP